MKHNSFLTLSLKISPLRLPRLPLRVCATLLLLALLTVGQLVPSALAQPGTGKGATRPQREQDLVAVSMTFRRS